MIGDRDDANMKITANFLPGEALSPEQLIA